MPANLSTIRIYPVKSCRPVELNEAAVTPIGLAGDRRYQVVDAGGAPVTQRQQPVLATVQPTLLAGGLRLESEGCPAIEVAAPTVTDTTATSLLGVPVESADAGDAAAAWFTDLIGVPVRLVGMVGDTGYALPIPGVEMRTGWADAASVSIASESSHAWLAERAREPFGIERFRANLTVSGTEPWVEDTWRDVSVGAARFGLGAPWPRCAIPQIDQLDGQRHLEPARVLKAHRWCDEAPHAPAGLRPFFEGSALFAVGCSVLVAGTTITVGDPVTVHETGDRVIAAPS